MPKHIIATLLLSLVFLFSAHSLANIDIQWQQPTWTFLIQNQLALGSDTLRQNEHSFVRSIQPLMANQQYDKVLQAFSLRPLESDSAPLQHLRGQILLRENQLPEAQKALTAALDQAPNFAEVHRSLSMAYVQLQQFDKAQQHLTQAIVQGVADAQCFGQLAFIYLQQNHGHSAIAAYQQALLLEPTNAQWQEGLLYALSQAKFYGQAQALLEERLQESPNNKNLWLLRSQIALAQDRTNDALSSMEVALRLGEQNPHNIMMATQLHLKIGSPDRATALMLKNIDFLNSQNSETILNNLLQNMAWLSHQQHWQKMALLLHALNNKKQFIPKTLQGDLLAFKGDIAIHQGKIQYAKEQYKNALAYHPANGHVVLRLGQLYASEKNYPHASTYFIRAQALEPVKEQAMLAHAQLEIDNNHYRQALTLLRQVENTTPNREGLADNINALEKIILQSEAN